MCIFVFDIAKDFLHIWQVVCDYETSSLYFSSFLFMLFVCVYEYVCDMGISSEITVLQTSCTQDVLCTFYLK